MENRRIFREEMICGICSELLKEPKMLICAHSFCKDCLDSTMHNCKSPSTGLQYEMEFEDEIEECNSKNKIECPVCLQITVLDAFEGTDNLDSNDRIQDKIATLKPEEKQEMKENIQNRQRIVASITMDKVFNICERHKMQQKFHCIDCNAGACVKCIGEIHDFHQYSEIPILIADSILQLQSLVQPAGQCASYAEASLQKLSQDYESINSNRKMCKDAITEVCNEVRAAIDEREKKLIDNIDNYIDKKLSEVMQQKKNLTEVQDQLYQSIQEVQELLACTIPPDISLLTEKQRLIDDTDVQKQNILDIKELAFKSMFSSTYVGFQDDSTKILQQEIDKLISLREFYPDKDSGYYLSRAIPVESEESLYMITNPRHLSSTLSSSSIQSSNTSIDNEDLVKAECEPEFKRKNLKRSKSTPSEETKWAWLTKKGNSFSTMGRVIPPSIPIRFESLLSPTPIIEPEKMIEKLAATKGENVYPCGICIGENNSFIISDINNHCLRIIASNGKFIGAIGKEGKGAGQFEEPSAVAVNQNGQIFVSQKENARVQKLTSGGKYLQKFGHKLLRGNSLGEPWGIAVAPDEKVYVTDWDKNCIHAFHSNGRYDYSIGGDSSILGESLKFPAGVTINASGNLVVADRGNHCVWVLETNGNILLRIGSKGHGSGELYFPYGVAVHQDGTIVVSESGNNRISLFSPSGIFLKHFGQRGSEPGMFLYPRHVCITPAGQLVVADELNRRLQLFKF